MKTQIYIDRLFEGYGFENAVKEPGNMSRIGEELQYEAAPAKRIYIVLSQSGTLFSKVIRCYTGDPYNHASIAFDKDLTEMYSFGRKKRFNVCDNGFVKENFDTGLYRFFPQARCCILEIPVTDEEYASMYQVIRFFLEHQQIYRYNLLGILGHVLGIGMTRRNRFFCSQFVSFILNKSSFWNQVPELTKPMDFYSISNKKLLFEGETKEYATWALNCVPTI